MSNEFINNEIDKIFNSKEFDFPLNISMASAWILGNLKGINLKVLDMQKTSTLADYFVLASATNIIQAKSMAEELSFQYRRLGFPLLSKEGMSDSDWLLLDSGDVITHIFLESSRDVYGLEELWSKAPTVKIPEDYYYSSEKSIEVNNSKDERDFF